MTESFFNPIIEYYSEKVKIYGATSQGVDWKDENSHQVRFEQLCKVIDPEIGDFSLNDLGCGYGALLHYLKNKFPLSAYLGVDISSEMIRTANQRNVNVPNTHFLMASEPDKIADYSVASGVFNVRLERTDTEWFDYLRSTLDVLDRTSRLGFAFNCLTSYSDEERKRDYLYYADPCRLFDLCKRRYSRQVALLHDYGLYEFTILVRKSP